MAMRASLMLAAAATLAMSGIAPASGHVQAPAPIVAQDAATDPDARCAVAILMAIDTLPEDEQNLFQLGAVYYIGKLIGRHGRDPALAILAEVGESMDGTDIEPVVRGCGRELIDLGAIMQKM